MSKPKKNYVMPFVTPEDKQKIRDWVGMHNGMSILRTGWRYCVEGISVNSIDYYMLSITNPKTEMLFILSFPEALEEDEFNKKVEDDWAHASFMP